MDEKAGTQAPLGSFRGAAQYHYDVIASLKRHFNSSSPRPLAGPEGNPVPRVLVSPDDYFEETGLRSCLAILTTLDAAFNRDYRHRCDNKLKDDLSRAFRAIRRRKPDQRKVSLEKDIFEAWCRYAPQSSPLIADLRAAFRFRNWLAHGRYWPPKLGRKYDFEFLYRLAETVFLSLPLAGNDHV